MIINLSVIDLLSSAPDIRRSIFVSSEFVCMRVWRDCVSERWKGRETIFKSNWLEDSHNILDSIECVSRVSLVHKWQIAHVQRLVSSFSSHLRSLTRSHCYSSGGEGNEWDFFFFQFSISIHVCSQLVHFVPNRWRCCTNATFCEWIKVVLHTYWVFCWRWCYHWLLFASF